MNLSRSNLLIRFGFLGTDYIPTQTSLCALFWRIVFRLLVVIGLASLVALYGYNWYAHTWSTFTKTLVFVLGLACLVGFAWWQDRLDAKRANRLACGDEPEPSLVRETFYAIKHKVCPVIRIGNGE